MRELVFRAAFAACVFGASLGAASCQIESLEIASASPMGEAAALLNAASAEDAEASEDSEGAPGLKPRGLGTITARVPGTNEVISGVRLTSHKVSVVIRDGFARTEVEEEFLNETPRVLEGRFVFPLPPDASVSRLALWVGKDLVEGEIVERRIAATIFKGIVDDTVRPRDPALLERAAGGELSLKIFPIPAKGSRKVVFAYNQVLSTAGGRVRYVYPLSMGADRASVIEDFSLAVTAFDSTGRQSDAATPRYPASIRAEDGKLEAAMSARSFAPAEDFVFSYLRKDGEGDVDVAAYTPRAGEFAASAAAKPSRSITTGKKDGEGATPEGQRETYIAIRATADLPEGESAPKRSRRSQVIVIDTSYSQSLETMDGETKLAAGLIRRMDPEETFVLLACDSACISYPTTGAASPSEAAIDGATRWLKERKPGGSSDIAGALFDAARRAPDDGSAQVVYIGDGSPSSGELSGEAIGARVKPILDERRVDLRLLGAGRTVDEVALNGLAAVVGATYERVSTGEPLAARLRAIALGLQEPVIRSVTIEAPPSLRDVSPRSLPAVRLGQQILLVGRLSGEGSAAGEASRTITIRGELAGAPYSQKKSISLDAATTAPGGGNPIVPRLWAEARLREIEAEGSDARVKESIEISKRFHVMSRYTSLLVLENDLMFAEFGIKRTTRSAADQSDNAFSNPEGSPSVARPDPVAAGFSSELSVGGHGEGASGAGFGFGGGRLGGFHAGSAPQIRGSATSVSGRLPPEVIQRIVRQNFGRFRLCYESGLRKNPELRGRVVVRFVIGREGSLTSAGNGGSDLPDSEVIACVVRAFSGLAFPQPEGGIVTVTYPIQFSPAGSSSSQWVSRRPGIGSPWSGPLAVAAPSAAHRIDDAGWMSSGEASLEKLRKAAEEQPSIRKRHDALIRGLLSRGRFQEALTRAMRFVEIDPDLASAQELLAYAAAASGDGALALASVDGLVESNPRKMAPHLRAAQAFEAAGDEHRACAHWRAAASIGSSGDELAFYEALRCRARMLDGVQAVLRDAKAMARRPASVDKLIALLEEGKMPRYEPRGALGGSFEVSIACNSSSDHCPTAAVIGPDGVVYSPWTPAPSRGGTQTVSLAIVVDGTYRTILVGGDDAASGEISVRALGSVKKTPFVRNGGRATLTTTVSGMSPPGFGLFGRLSFG